MKAILRVLSELENGVATSQDIADELGMSIKTASAWLSEIHGMGYTTRFQVASPERHGRRSYAYELKEYGHFLAKETA